MTVLLLIMLTDADCFDAPQASDFPLAIGIQEHGTLPGSTEDTPSLASSSAKLLLLF